MINILGYDRCHGVFNILNWRCIPRYYNSWVLDSWDFFPWKIKSQNGKTLFPETFYLKDFSPHDLIFRKLFSENFFGGYPADYTQTLSIVFYLQAPN